MHIVASPLQYLLEVVMAFATEHADEVAIIFGDVISNLRFADDIAVLEVSKDGLQMLVSNIHKIGLKISISKTEVQRIACDDGSAKQ